ncbi:MAG: ATP-binding protein [Syntrophales bacterium]|nr:ATP-binding protein [Syntrophales bacterium]
MKEKRSKLYLHLKKWLEKASVDYGMIGEGDRVLVGVSGGVDSLVLLDLLNTPMVFLPRFSILAVNIDMGFDEEYVGYATLERYLKENGYEYVMEKTDIGPLAHSDYNKKNPCFLCSRMRRKRIFEIANENGCNKIAFAHHKDDIIETLLINIFYGREISTMMPDQSVFGGKFHLIRPFAYIREPLIKKYAKERGLPVVENICPTSKTSRRIYIKRLLDDMERDNKDVRENIFKAMSHVKMDYLPGRDVDDDTPCKISAEL